MTETNFKHTDLGLIPHDWEVKTIKEFADITTGSQNTQDHVDDGKYPFFVRSPKVERINKFIFDTEGVITAGDGVGTGKIFHYIKGKFGLHQRCYLMYNFEDVSAKYFYWIFSQHFYDRVQSMTAKSSVDSVRMEMIADMPIPLPPTLAEQERIAGALSSIDTLIGALTEQIEKKRHIKQGAMQQLLTGKKRLAGFTGEWKEVRLGDVANLKSGYAFKSTTYSNIGTFKIITIANVQNGVLDMSDYNKIAEIPSNIQEHQILKEGDILVSMTGNVGRVCRVDCKNCLLNQRVGVFALKNTIDAEYLYVILDSLEFEKEMTGKGHGAAQPNIGSSDVESYCFVVPPTIAEQSAIAAVLSRMDTEIAALEQKRDKYIAVKSGMMQNLLTGKIRLV